MLPGCIAFRRSFFGFMRYRYIKYSQDALDSPGFRWHRPHHNLCRAGYR